MITERLNELFWIYLVGINLYTLILMYYDKRQARKREWRIPENQILLAGVLGGGPAGLISQQLFRHKTKKPKFYVAFIIGSVVFCGILYFYFTNYYG
ncbi:DUF1294 domain-containing protein [Enterococcus larvae]|uniref:DUF1294 domain-containing protein n=1 Tax=Enterococcus larvae TaxID=2794352 RepID=UPI003F2E441B